MGKVVDATTNEALPFASVVLQGNATPAERACRVEGTNRLVRRPVRGGGFWGL